MGYGEKPDYITVKGAICFIKHDNDPWYPACPTEGCNKKVIPSHDNKWRCEKCDMEYEEVCMVVCVCIYGCVYVYVCIGDVYVYMYIW